MKNTQKTRSLMCVFNLDNTQDHYARCLSDILQLERVPKRETENDALPMRFFVTEIGSEQRIRDSDTVQVLESYFEKHPPLKQYESLSEFSKDREGYKEGLLYYFRITITKDEGDLVNLQYLLLLLQVVSQIRDRTAIYFINGEKTDTAGTDGHFFRLACYMQNIRQKYDIFYSYNPSSNAITKLSTFHGGPSGSFLPLTEINPETLSLLRSPLHVSHDKILFDRYFNVSRPEGFKKLYQALTVWSPVAGTPEIKDQIQQMCHACFRMMLNALNGNKYRALEAKRALIEQICSTLDASNGTTLLSVLLFGALTTGERLENEEELKDHMAKIVELSNALFQILENIVNHSERHIGSFTFRLQDNKQYIRETYPEYSPGESRALEFLIADTNFSDNIITNYINSGKSSQMLREIGSGIRLAEFFGRYRNAETADIWRMARQQNPMACYGLLMFSNSIEEMNGAILVRSSCRFQNASKDDLYYNVSKNAYLDRHNEDRCYIPGTQFSILVSRPLKANALELEKRADQYDAQHLLYTCTYRELALLLKCNKETCVSTFDTLVPRFSEEPAGAGDPQGIKDRQAVYWKDFFNEEYKKAKKKRAGNSYQTVEFDLHVLTQRGFNYEPFCKGLFQSLFFAQDADQEAPKTDKSDLSGYCILLRNIDEIVYRVFRSTLKVAWHYIGEEKSCIYFYPGEPGQLPRGASSLIDLLKELQFPAGKMVGRFPRVFPYALFEKAGKDKTEFENEIIERAGCPITGGEKQGYKIENTHMRLGNKVHLDAFYEMALFFEDSNNAYYTAFLFARKLLDIKKELKNKVIIYGYASYSRAIVWALVQILNTYYGLNKEEDGHEFEFVIYQNDMTLESTEPQIQMYYSRMEWQLDPGSIWDPDEASVTMIVPISSSLTTFKKMQLELENKTGKAYTDYVFFTAFWVRNAFNKKNAELPTEEEKQFWSKCFYQNRSIICRGPGLSLREVYFLVDVNSKWENALYCEKCFPHDVLQEYPLVETDPTSTVPTQQLYIDNPDAHLPVDLDLEDENDTRIVRLKSNMRYGHVSHGNNHFQYYVKTRAYFQQEKDYIKGWLEALGKTIPRTGTISVLVLPKQITNVEFCQFVYEYCFGGEAYSIVVNPEKEYRSNFAAEYSALFHLLEEKKNAGYAVCYYYVDMSISSGASFNRIKSLMQASASHYGGSSKTFAFQGVILLISRLSNESKRAYVADPQKNFHAYVELDISSMRRFGDSCVSCKIQKDANRFYNMAATKSISAYWEEKVYTRRHINFDMPEDDLEKKYPTWKKMQEDGYRRMLCSHRINRYLELVRGGTVEQYFTSMRQFFDEIIQAAEAKDEKEVPAIYRGQVSAEDLPDWLSAALKIIARPFFSFDYRLKCAVMDFFLLTAEFILTPDAGTRRNVEQFARRIKAGEKEYLVTECAGKKTNLEWCAQFVERIKRLFGHEKDMLTFFRSNVLKGLADIKSNYLMRKPTLVRIHGRLSELGDVAYMEEFYRHYTRMIIRLTHSSSDEAKCVWLEHLIQTSREYRKDLPEQNGRELNNLKGAVSHETERFESFLRMLQIENNRVLFQAVSQLERGPEEEGGYRRINNVMEFLHHEYADDQSCETCLKSLRELYVLLNGKQSPMIDKKYEELRSKLLDVVMEGKPLDQNTADVIIYGERDIQLTRIEHYQGRSNYYLLSPAGDKIEAHEKKEICQDGGPTDAFTLIMGQIDRMLKESPNRKGQLEELGYTLLPSWSTQPAFDILIKIDNNYNEIKDYLDPGDKPTILAPIYIFIMIGANKEKAYNILRKILVFRKKLIEWIEQDFNNNAVLNMMQQRQVTTILSNDKVGDHTEQDFITDMQRTIMTQRPKGPVDGSGTNGQGFDEKIKMWTLLRSYVNLRIARLFRTAAKETTGVEYEMELYNCYSMKDQKKSIMSSRNLGEIFEERSVGGKDGTNMFGRANYISEVLNCVTLRIQGEEAFESREVERLLGAFCCKKLMIDGAPYTFLSEYVAVILLDCIFSGLRENENWNTAAHEEESYRKMIRLPPDQKCIIEIYRRTGGTDEYDDLVIRNKMSDSQRSEDTGRKHFGMSKIAIQSYIDTLWEAYYNSLGKRHPPKTRYEPRSEESGRYFYVSLPILEPSDGQNKKAM